MPLEPQRQAPLARHMNSETPVELLGNETCVEMSAAVTCSLGLRTAELLRIERLTFVECADI